MPDNLHIRQPQDPQRINVNEPWEVRYWTNKFNVTEAQLKQAVKAVGPMTAKVKAYLGK
ncbi:hypothetical protein GALL_193450 [mine drainage metagenome]|uniref:DUF3606 domain-containing protein n=1 Tax=mine drainage metagenome TaxID=410659 RepID=A0A1J5S3G8_9ZZZZ